jgi:hypothetical protein
LRRDSVATKKSAEAFKCGGGWLKWTKKLKSLLRQRRQLQKAHPQHVFHPQIDFSPSWFLHFLSRSSKTTNSRKIPGMNSDFMGWHEATRTNK